jgi:hypothetical protein
MHYGPSLIGATPEPSLSAASISCVVVVPLY